VSVTAGDAAGDGRLSKRERLTIQRQEMPARRAEVRVRGFDEVNLGFTEKIALLEARRCLQCRQAPCVTQCPVGLDIPAFVSRLEIGDLAGAAEVLLHGNPLPAVTGRVCPQEQQCEAVCVLARKGTSVAIGHLERFVADWARRSGAGPAMAPPADSGHEVAVVGSGPGGLTAAGELAMLGHRVTVYEALHQPGGVLIYGIPEYRLPNEIVTHEVERLERLGVRFECNVVIGRTYSLAELRDAFHAVFLSVGAGLPVFLGVPGENAKGVYSANEYLTRVNLMRAYAFPEADTPVLRGRRVVVVGGGNVALDAVRTAKRLGAEDAILAYRRTRTEMPARQEEVRHGEEEGVRFQFLVAPVAVEANADRWVTGLRCTRMELGEPDDSGRRRPTPIDGSEHVIPCDTVVSAIGTRANPLLTSSCPELELAPSGNILTDERGMTNLPGVFAGGDIVRGSATVILAMGDGKRVGHAIDGYLVARAPPTGKAGSAAPTELAAAATQRRSPT
jgi:glutamate synthase (NADPH/NADH) small chain